MYMAEEKIDYGIKYRVIKLDKKKFLLFPVSLVKGEDTINGFQTDKTLFSYASTELDFKNKYIVDNIFAQDELESIYEYDKDDEFLGEYFYEDHKDTIIYVDANSKDGWMSRNEINLNILGNQEEVTFMMDESIPSIILNDKALKELTDSNNLEEVKLLLEKYKKLLNSFSKANKEKGVTKIKVVNGKVDTIETSKRVVKVPKDLKKDIKTKKSEKSSSTISYNGLRKYLKERIYGHDEALDTVAQKLYMNYTAEEGEIVESILLVGPTGTGKTETIRAASSYLGLPFAEVNASNLVPQGIKGMSIEDVLIELYTKAGKDLKKAERGIVFLDEFDKLKEGDAEIKGPVKNILLTFTSGGTFPIDGEDFSFNSAMVNKVYAGVFERINERRKQVGFNSNLQSLEPLGSEDDIRKKIIGKGYYTLEELSRISCVLGYDEIDRETKKQILMNSKLSEFAKKKNRYKRQFGIDLIADETYIDALLDSIEKSATGMRSVNNLVKRSINEAEKKLLEEETYGLKKLVLTRDTVEDSKKFILK